jgi:hypothetical protein
MKKLMQHIGRMFARKRLLLANIAEATHGDGNITKKVDAAQATRHVLVKIGSDIDHVAVTTACTENPLGVTDDEAAAAEDNINVQLLGQKKGTILIVGTATAGDLLEAAASGKAVTLTGGAGAHYIIGRALNTATDDLIEVAHCLPVLRTV